jgi:hypothetical protein
MVICYNSGIQRKVDMDIRVRAAVKTVVILGYVALIAVAVQLILKYTPLELLQYSVTTLVGGGLVYWMYTIVLDRLRSQEILDKLNSKG